MEVAGEGLPVVQKWREQCQRDFTNLLDAIRVSTQTLAIVIEPDLVGVLRTVFGEDLSLLQTYGVERMVLLTPDSWEFEDLGLGDTEFVVYVVRPVPTWMRIIAGHVQYSARKSHSWPTTVSSKASSPDVTHPLSYLNPKPGVSSNGPAGTTNFSIIFTPQYSVVCDRVLEEEGVKGLVGIYEYALHLLPYGDVLSMEHEDSFRDIFVENETSSLFYIVRSLLQLQRTYGTITNIKGRGMHAQTVADMLLKYTQEEADSRKRRYGLASEENGTHQKDEKEGEDASRSSKSRSKDRNGRREDSNKTTYNKIDTLIILDRSMDLVTPLITQFTYEGLLAEIMGIDYGSTEVNKAVLPAPEDFGEDAQGKRPRGERNETMQGKGRGRRESGRGGGRGQGRRGVNDDDEEDQMVRISLYGSSRLFDNLRDVNFGNLQQVLQEKARVITPKYMKIKGTLRQDEKEGHLLPEDELQSVLSDFSTLQTEYQSLQLHTNIADKIMHATRSPTFAARLQYEQRLVATGDVGRNPLLEQAINAGGLPPPAFDKYRRMIIAKYGMQHMCTLHNLEVAGLLVPLVGKPMFPKLRELLRLIVPEAQNGQPFDIAYTCSGYAPLSIRIVEAAANEGWQGGELKRLHNILGPVFEYSVNEEGEVIDDDSRQDKRRDGRRAKDRSPRDRRPDTTSPTRVALVFIIGGMTYAEAAALRLLSSRGPIQYVIGTTKLLNGDSFLNPLVERLY